MSQDSPSLTDIDKFINTLKDVKLEYPFGEEVGVYKVKDKMFALVSENKNPINISLKCDPNLSETLRENYDSVMPGYHLNKKHWITIILSGQLSWDEVKDLIILSYNLVSN